MINYTYMNLTLCWNFPLQTSISAHFYCFAKLSTAVLWLLSKAKKQCVSSLKRHLFAFYNSYVVLWKWMVIFLCINLKKTHNILRTFNMSCEISKTVLWLWSKAKNHVSRLFFKKTFVSNFISLMGYFASK